METSMSRTDEALSSICAVEILQGLIPDKTSPISGSVFGLSADYISHSFARTCRKAGIEDLRFHDLRHEVTSRFF